MSSEKTPVSDKTVSKTEKTTPTGPTPKNEFKKPFTQRVLHESYRRNGVSMHTEADDLQTTGVPKKIGPGSNNRPKLLHVSSHKPPSQLADKENVQKTLPPKTMEAVSDSQDSSSSMKPLETNV